MVELVAVADCRPERLQLAKDTFGEELSVFSTAEELIHSGKCEAVLIATPHYYHPSIAIKAMEAGLHVLVEKPAGVYTKQVRAMDEVAAKHPELVYCIDFNQRTNPVYQKVKELLESGELGQMKRVIWIITDWYRSQSYYDQGGWRATWDGEGGGVGAVFHLKVQQLPQGGEIHGLFGKGRDNGHTGPGEERLFQCTHAPFQLEMGN